ncbi:SURF1-like protein [Agaricicola taiwanensis]|uniref:SURF1-like protein n=1 Tax=Agaricicola taiwanensis TaxID=591372 RepID=A0A8J2VIR3_9RHOB|nr:SURF1 family protein [Agaricicola taiwanensis]GGE32000.1 SURF1-like protein [Agaricicola taiwanensis]
MAQAPGDRTERHRRPRSALALSIMGLLAALGVVVLTGLGLWQVERRAWKLDLIARVDARIHAAPVAAPGPASWPQMTAAGAEYRKVQVRGRFLHDREVLVQAVTDFGGGFWVMTPLATSEGFTVFVNRGFVPTDRRAASSRMEGQVEGETTVTGLLRLSEPGGAFLRSNDPAADRWYSRDVAAMAQSRDIDEAAPYFIDADRTANPGGLPVGGLTVVRFYNNHLVYLLTWFALDAMLVGAIIFVAYDERRLRRAARGGSETMREA